MDCLQSAVFAVASGLEERSEERTIAAARALLQERAKSLPDVIVTHFLGHYGSVVSEKMANFIEGAVVKWMAQQQLRKKVQEYVDAPLMTCLYTFLDNPPQFNLAEAIESVGALMGACAAAPRIKGFDAESDRVIFHWEDTIPGAEGGKLLQIMEQAKEVDSTDAKKLARSYLHTITEIAESEASSMRKMQMVAWFAVFLRKHVVTRCNFSMEFVLEIIAVQNDLEKSTPISPFGLFLLAIKHSIGDKRLAFYNLTWTIFLSMLDVDDDDEDDTDKICAKFCDVATRIAEGVKIVYGDKKTLPKMLLTFKKESSILRKRLTTAWSFVDPRNVEQIKAIRERHATKRQREKDDADIAEKRLREAAPEYGWTDVQIMKTAPSKLTLVSGCSDGIKINALGPFPSKEAAEEIVFRNSLLFSMGAETLAFVEQNGKNVASPYVAWKNADLVPVTEYLKSKTLPPNLVMELLHLVLFRYILRSPIHSQFGLSVMMEDGEPIHIVSMPIVKTTKKKMKKVWGTANGKVATLLRNALKEHGVELAKKVEALCKLVQEKDIFTPEMKEELECLSKTEDFETIVFPH